jgi:hypothetical protein
MTAMPGVLEYLPNTGTAWRKPLSGNRRRSDIANNRSEEHEKFRIGRTIGWASYKCTGAYDT